jgi:Beta-propeller repeat
MQNSDQHRPNTFPVRQYFMLISNTRVAQLRRVSFTGGRMKPWTFTAPKPFAAAILALTLAACSSPMAFESGANGSGDLNPTDIEAPDLLEAEVVLTATPGPWTGIKDLVTDFQRGTVGLDVATDANNNVFVPVLRSAGLIVQTPEYALVKLDAGGNIVWSIKRDVGVPNYVSGFWVATDPAGNVYMAGTTSINLEGQRLSGQQDAFVTKYNTNGKIIWTRLIGAGADDGATGVGVDSSGEVYVSGWTCGTGLRLGGNSIRGGCDMFVTKFSNGGARRWVQLVGTDGNELAGTMAVAANGTIAVTGNTSAAFPGFGAPATDENAAFTAKLSSGGAINWVKQFNGTAARDVTIDSAGDVVTYGNSSTSELPRPQGVSGNLPILRKLRGNDGQRLWSTLTQVNQYSNHFGVHVEAGPGNVLYVSDSYNVFGAFGNDLFKFNPDGSELPPTGGPGANLFNASISVRGNNAYVAGYTESNNCRPTPYPGNCTSQIARVAKFDLNLNLQ